jgi:cytochrome b
MSNHQNHPLWDLPTRLFHWLLVLGVFLSWLSHEQDWIEVHLWSGYGVLVLVAFRILWGFFGSVHSRFTDFVRGPSAVLRYWRGERPDTAGHSPAGAWSILVLLALLLVQAGSGLFNSDGLLFDGPLHHALDSDLTDQLGELHDQLFWVILGFIGLHVAAVLYYQFVRREPLLGAMVTGGARGARAPVSLWRALGLLLLCGGLLALAVYLAPEPEYPW